MSPQWVDYLVVLGLGAMIGFVEILARYKDAPFKVSFSLPGAMYILINAVVAGLALWGVRLFDLRFTDNPNWSEEMVRWLQIGVSGLSAMALFRSSLFMFRVGDQDVSVGPNAILQILLVAVDKEVDRKRGAQRARIVEEAMEGITYEEASKNLPPVVLALMQNLSPEDRNEIPALVESAGEMLKKGVPERAVTMALGLGMINVVGEDILKAAIDMVNLNKDSRPAAAENLLDKVMDKIGGEKTTEAESQTKPGSAEQGGEASALPTEIPNDQEIIAPAVEKLKKKLGRKSIK